MMVTFAICHIHMYMLCAKYGSGQSVDCLVQYMDPQFAQYSVDCARNPWIVPCAKHGSTQSMDCSAQTIPMDCSTYVPCAKYGLELRYMHNGGSTLYTRRQAMHVRTKAWAGFQACREGLPYPFSHEFSHACFCYR